MHVLEILGTSTAWNLKGLHRNVYRLLDLMITCCDIVWRDFANA